jgi:hypothetical protein
MLAVPADIGRVRPVQRMIMIAVQDADAFSRSGNITMKFPFSYICECDESFADALVTDVTLSRIQQCEKVTSVTKKNEFLVENSLTLRN